MRQRHTLIRSFTLIELLVVISVIAVLIALLLPALGAAKETARKAICLSQERQVVTGLHMYSQEFNGLVPPNLRYNPYLTEHPLTYDFSVNYLFAQNWGGWGFLYGGAGILYPEGYLSVGDAYFCPSQEENVFVSPPGAPYEKSRCIERMKDITLTASGAAFTSYLYRCSIELGAGNGAGLRAVRAVDQADLTAFSDWFRPWSPVSYPYDIMMHTDGFQAAKYDGSARYYSAPEFTYKGTTYTDSQFPYIPFLIADDP